MHVSIDLGLPLSDKTANSSGTQSVDKAEPSSQIRNRFSRNARSIQYLGGKIPQFLS